MIPSTKALFYIGNGRVGNQADKNTHLSEQYGWKITDNELTIVWGTEENIRNIQMCVDAILKGCKCTTGCQHHVGVGRKAHCVQTGVTGPSITYKAGRYYV